MNSLLKTNQQALCFARRSENLSSDLRIKNGLRLYNDKEVVHWINPKAKNNVYHPSNYYAFNRLNFKAINRLLLEASEREDQMKKQGYNLEGVKSFNRNVWLDISRESNAIEGIFRDFSFDLLDFRAKLKGKIASDPSTKNFDRQDYFNKLFDQILEVQQHNDSIVITGKEHPHKLSMQTVRHFIAFKYAYKCAKKDRFQKVTKEEFLNMLLNVNSLIFGGSGGGTRLIGLRNSKALVSGANWVPPAEIDEIDEKLTALADWVTDDKQSGMLHPIEKAAIFHAEFIRIHPFFDGNGRTGRIMANYLLIVDEFPSIAIKQRFDKDKTEKPYFEALDKAIMTHEIDDLIGLFYKECYRSAKNLHMCFDAVEESQNIEKTNSL